MQKQHSLALVLCAVAACGCSSSDGGSEASGGHGAQAGASTAGGSSGAANNGGSTTLGGTHSGGSSAGGASGGNAPHPSGGSAGGSGATGSSGAGGSSGSGGSAGSAMVKECPMAPTGAVASAVTAINLIDAIRGPMGVQCANLMLTLDQSAQAHCDYYAGNTKNTMCVSNSISPHNEVSGCTGFTGASPGDRVKAAGYHGNGLGEVMAFNDDPQKAVNQWINSVWHRTPLLSPWWTDMGYGSATGCDVIDLGPGTQSPTSTSAMYPYPGQTGVPPSFNGNEESPLPPAPPKGWPSGSPITLYLQKATTVSHTIVVDGTNTPLDHQWIDYNQPNTDNDDQQLIMYTNVAMTANTKYHVTIAVTLGGSPKTFDWTFTTGS